MKRYRTWHISAYVLLLCLAYTCPIFFTLHINTKQSHPPFWPIPAAPIPAQKAYFINTLIPLIQAQNRHLLLERQRLLTMKAGIDSLNPLPETDRRWLSSLAKTYRVEDKNGSEITDLINELLNRIDMIPADFVVAQAALESHWGTAKVAQQTNNYFGIWCFTAGCGLPVTSAGLPSHYELQYFASLADAIDAHFLNLNTNSTYHSLRALRSALRQAQQPLTGTRLSTGLQNSSSTTGSQLRQIIRENRLTRFNSFALAP